MEMERCEWILCLYVLVVQLLRLAGRVGRDSGGKRNLRVGAGMDLLMWSWPALCIYHSTGEWSMKIFKWVVWDVEASSWHGKLMRSKSNYMPDAWYSIYFARKKKCPGFSKNDVSEFSLQFWRSWLFAGPLKNNNCFRPKCSYIGQNHPSSS